MPWLKRSSMKSARIIELRTTMPAPGSYNRGGTEIELARRLAAGEPAAFEAFVAHFRTKIFQYSWLMCRDREDAEEVARETLLKIFESFDQLREPERVRPWVFRIAKNACLMKRRKSVFAPERELSLDEFMRLPQPGAAARRLRRYRETSCRLSHRASNLPRAFAPQLSYASNTVRRSCLSHSVTRHA